MNIIKILLISFFLHGCSSMHLIDNTSSPQAIISQIKSGDFLHVEHTDGSKYAVEVVSIDANSIKGHNIEIPLNKIKSIEREGFSFWKTATLTYIILAVSYALVAPVTFLG